MKDLPGNPQDCTIGAVSQIEAIDDELVSRLVFRIRGHAVAHEPERVGELVRDPAIHRVPNAPTVLAGLLNSRGRVVPVFDIRRLLPRGGDPAPASGAIEWVLVFHDHEQGDDGSADDCVGLVIDEMPVRLRLTPMRHRPTDELPELFRPWCRRVHERERSLYGEIDMVAMIESLGADTAADGQEPPNRSASDDHAGFTEHTISCLPAARPATTSRESGLPGAPNGDGRYD